MAEETERYIKDEVEITLTGMQTIPMLNKALQREKGKFYSIDWSVFRANMKTRVIVDSQEPYVRTFKFPVLIKRQANG